MKVFIKNPDTKVRSTLESSATPSSPEGVIVDFMQNPLHLNSAVGAIFSIRYSKDGGKTYQETTIQRVGDGTSFLMGGTVFRLPVEKGHLVKGSQFRIDLGFGGKQWVFDCQEHKPIAAKKNANLGKNAGQIKAPLTGKVLKNLVKVGDWVEEGQTLLVIEAMKMENQIQSEWEGQVKEIRVAEGGSVTNQDLLVILDLNAKKESTL